MGKSCGAFRRNCLQPARRANRLSDKFGAQRQHRPASQAADSRPETCNGACACARLVRLCKCEGIARFGRFALSVASDDTAGANSYVSAIRTKRTVAFQFPAVERTFRV